MHKEANMNDTWFDIIVITSPLWLFLCWEAAYRKGYRDSEREHARARRLGGIR